MYTTGIHDVLYNSAARDPQDAPLRQPGRPDLHLRVHTGTSILCNMLSNLHYFIYRVIINLEPTAQWSMIGLKSSFMS